MEPTDAYAHSLDYSVCAISALHSSVASHRRLAEQLRAADAEGMLSTHAGGCGNLVKRRCCGRSRRCLALVGMVAIAVLLLLLLLVGLVRHPSQLSRTEHDRGSRHPAESGGVESLSWTGRSPVTAAKESSSSIAGTTMPLVDLLPPPPSSFVPRHAVAIMFSLDRAYCHYALVTWRSVRRLDPQRHKDVLLTIQRDEDWEEALASAGKATTREERIKHLQEAFATSVAAKWPTCQVTRALATMLASPTPPIEWRMAPAHSSALLFVCSGVFFFLRRWSISWCMNLTCKPR
jgi:hypothetical protein